MGGVSTVKDPYEVLQMPHSATSQEIKDAYRKMARKYHPDKSLMISQNESERQQATTKFSECASAYAILSDAQKKAEYDHIYKYGGYDDDGDSPKKNISERTTTTKADQHLRRKNKNKPTMGVGYTCYDPCTFLWTHGRIESQRTMAGIQLPSRRTRSVSSSSFGVVIFSTGRIMKDCTNTKLVTETKKYYPHEKRVRTVTETVTLHPDGRQDFVIEEGDGSRSNKNNINDESKRRRQEYSTFATSNHHQRRIHMNHNEFPWYIHAWNKVHAKLSMCYNPCATVRD